MLNVSLDRFGASIIDSTFDSMMNRFWYLYISITIVIHSFDSIHSFIRFFCFLFAIFWLLSMFEGDIREFFNRAPKFPHWAHHSSYMCYVATCTTT
jgi:hypothetical protein